MPEVWSHAVKYRTIVADPPWPIGDFPEWASGKGGSRISTPYSTMTLDEIAGLPVEGLADHLDGDAHLYLWTTTRFLETSFRVARSWGFEYSATLVWCKATIGTGLGGTWPNNVEFVLYCRKPGLGYRENVATITTRINAARKQAGITLRQLQKRGFTEGQIVHWTRSAPSVRLQVPSLEQWVELKKVLPLGDDLDDLVAQENTNKNPPLDRTTGCWFNWPRGQHSEKPEAFLDLVEQVSPGPYLELFARRQRLGWDTWGDEALDHLAASGNAIGSSGERDGAPTPVTTGAAT